ncbi:hypothetical protein [Nostocoides australiense]|nr:hypothetical protein [Tetrasphaera australiensis]HRW01847.1 hypothetical protein [Tetrasphaera sp.]
MTAQPEPRRAGLLPVAWGDEIYWEEWGSASGLPALYLHGGPGGSLGTSAYRHRFDLDRSA